MRKFLSHVFSTLLYASGNRLFSSQTILFQEHHLPSHRLMTTSPWLSLLWSDQPSPAPTRATMHSYSGTATEQKYWSGSINYCIATLRINPHQ